MKWTNEQPTKPGWYWYRDHNQMKVIRHLSEYMINTTEFVGQWSGPIPEPED